MSEDIAVKALIKLRSLFVTAIVALFLGNLTFAQAPPVTTTTVQGTVYRADGSVAGGTLIVSWPAFSTAAGQAVAAGNVTVTIAVNGSVSLNLAPNAGALPAGTYYTAIYHLSDGTVSKEYWLVPAIASTTIASVRAQLVPSNVAIQAVSKQYVDNAIASLSGGGSGAFLSTAGGTLSGPLVLSADPVSSNQAATKHYVDLLSASAFTLGGGTLTGPLNLYANPSSTSSDFLAATTGLVRAVAPRSVLEFGAVCDGVTNDSPAFQAAVNWALTNNAGVSFPKGTCYLAAPVIWNGVSMRGQGREVSILKENPGFDVFQMPDAGVGPLTFASRSYVGDFTILMDNSVDASLNGIGRYNRSAGYNTVFAPNQVGYTPAALPAWQIGACAFAMPSTEAPLGGLNGTVFANIHILAPNLPNRAGGTAGFCFQALPYAVAINNVTIEQTEFGVMELPPVDKTIWAAFLSNPNTSSDTNVISNFETHTTVGIDMLLGAHNSITDAHLYSRGKYQSNPISGGSSFSCVDGRSAAVVIEPPAAGGSGVAVLRMSSIYSEPGCLSTNAVLTADINATATSIPISDTRQFFPNGGTIFISIVRGAGEWVNYSAITAGTFPAGTLTGVTRGAMGTTAIAHVGTGASPEQVNIPAVQIGGSQVSMNTGHIKQGTGGIVVITGSDNSSTNFGFSGGDRTYSDMQIFGNRNLLATSGMNTGDNSGPGDVLEYGFGNKIISGYDTNSNSPAKFINAGVRPLPSNKLTTDWLTTGGPFFQSLDDILFIPEQMMTPAGVGQSFGSNVPIVPDPTAPVSQRYIYVPLGTALTAKRFNGVFNYLLFGQIVPMMKTTLNLWGKADTPTTVTYTISGQTGVCSWTTSWSQCQLPMDFTSQTAGTITELDSGTSAAGIKYSAVAIVPAPSTVSTAALTQHIAHVCLEDYLTPAMNGDYAQGYTAAVLAQSLITPSEIRACVPGNHPWGSGGAGGVADRPIATDFSGSTMVLSIGLASTPVNLTGTVTAGSLTVAVSSTAGLAIGQHIGGAGLLPDTIITGVNTGASTITLSQYPLLVVNGTTSATSSVTNLSSIVGLATGQTVTGFGVTAGTTIATLDTSGYALTLSAPTTATSANGQALTVAAGSWSTPLSAITVKRALRYTYNAAALHNYQGQMVGGEIRNVWFTDPAYRSLTGVAGVQIDAWDTLPINHLRVDNIAGSELIIGGSDGANVVRESDFWGLQLRDGGEPTTGQASLVINTPPGTVGSDEDNNLRFDGHVVFPYFVGEYIGTANLNHTGTNGPRLIYHTSNFQVEGGGRILQSDGTYANVYIAKPYNLVHVFLAGDIYYQGAALNIPGLGKAIFRVDTARYVGATGGRLEPIANGTFIFNVTVTAGSPTVTYVSYPVSNAIKGFDFSAGGTLAAGTRVLIGSTVYIVQSVAASGTTLTLTSNFSGSSGSTTMTQTDGGFYFNVTNSLITAQTSGYYNDFSAPGLGLAGLATAAYPNLFQGLASITSGYGFEDYQGRDKRGEGLDVVADSGDLPGLSVGSGANNSSFIGIGGSFALANWRYFAGFGGGQAIMQASYQKNLCLMMSSPSNTFAVGTCALQLTNTTNAVTTPQTTLDDGSGNSIFAKTTAATFATASNCASGSSPAICGSASAGAAIVAPGTTTQTVNTTAIGANSEIIVQQDNGLGSRLSVTCYTGGNTNPYVTGRVAGTSFTFTAGAPVTNPGCYNYIIINK